MTSRPSGTGQFKKLFFNKTFSDEYGVRWRLSTWKVLAWMIAITLIMVVLYSFSVPNQQGYLSNALFYGIMTMIIIMILWLVANLAWKSRKFIYGFIIGFLLIFGFYLLLHGIFFLGLGWKFHYGFSTWIVITILAGWGANHINGKLERDDVLFGMIVFVAFIVGNYPAFESGGFFAQVDKFVAMVSDILSKIIHPGDLIAK